MRSHKPHDMMLWDALWERYEAMVQRYTKQSEGREAVDHMIYGLLTELGELADVFKRCYYYGENLDMDHFTEEMGDILFYYAGLRLSMMPHGGPMLSEIMQQNIDKLEQRYPDGYSDEAAQERADKKV